LFDIYIYIVEKQLNKEREISTENVALHKPHTHTKMIIALKKKNKKKTRTQQKYTKLEF